MKLLSVNIAEKKSIRWRGKDVTTGIFKNPTKAKVLIKKTGVVNDCVVDKKYHGSPDMAVYLYSADHYEFWKSKYPKLDWSYGMIGENLTIEGLNETDFCFGDSMKIGDKVVLQITQPRQPCFKLGVRFGTQKIVKDFINAPYPGLYARVLEEGEICTGDKVEVLKKVSGGLPILEFWKVLFEANRERSSVERCLLDKYLSDEAKASFKRKLA